MEELKSVVTGKKIGCVQHDCEGCRKMDKVLTEAEEEAAAQILAEKLAGNVAKEMWWRGKLTGLRVAQALRSNANSAS